MPNTQDVPVASALPRAEPGGWPNGLGEGPTGQPLHTPLVIVAYGKPIGQGNVRSLGKGRPSIHQNASLLKPWRETLGWAARDVLRGQPDALGKPWLYRDLPLQVSVIFTVPKPKSAPKRKRSWPTTRPDLDHLLRAVGDALTGLVWADDSQILRWVGEKVFPFESAGALDRPGAVVTVERAP